MTADYSREHALSQARAPYRVSESACGLISSCRLTELIPGDRRQIFPKFLPFPPRAGFPALLIVRKTITIKHRPDVFGRFIRERVARKQSSYIARSFQKPDD